MSHPLISCLTITRDRPHKLRRAVDMFHAQTYPNKHLTIVVDPRGDNDWCVDFDRWLDGHPDIEFIKCVAGTCVADLRNFAVELAMGEIVTTWDDDDYYHPSRLDTQFDQLVLSKKDACYLMDSVFWFEDTQEMAFTVMEVAGLPASMMARKKAMPKYLPPAEIAKLKGDGFGERSSDTPVQMGFFHANQLTQVEGKPWLYVRSYHGKNMWAREHIERAARWASFETSRIESEGGKIVEKLREFFPWQVPDFVINRDHKKIKIQ